MSAYFYNRFQKNELAKVAFTSIATKPRRKTVAKFADEMYGSVEDYEEDTVTAVGVVRYCTEQYKPKPDLFLGRSN